MSREDYVDGCEMLLRFEEETHKEGEAYSWETMDNTVANFTADITPLILAAHRFFGLSPFDKKNNSHSPVL